MTSISRRSHSRLLPLQAALLFAFAPQASGQDADTLVQMVLRPVVVTAERSPVEQARTTAAVSVLTRSELQARPLQNLADALGTTPGFAFLNGDGAGTPPVATVRGFYGGGETEYVLLLLDGVPVNDVETGVVDWDLVPLAAVERVEILRGGASSLWGDAAIGAVVNVVTRDAAGEAGRVSFSGGSHDTYFAQGHGRAAWRGGGVSGFGSVKRYGGWREHAARTLATAGATVDLVARPEGRVAFTTFHSHTDADLPGPVLGANLAGARTSSAPFYRFDGLEERRHRLGLDARWRPGRATTLDAQASGGWRRADVVRTLPLSPAFADTKQRALDGGRFEGSVQLAHDAAGLPLSPRLVVGSALSLQTLASEYASVVAGEAADYLNADPAGALPVEARGDGTRRALSAFVQAEVRPLERLRLVAGARLDALRDVYDVGAPDPEGEVVARHRALSPRAGVNVQLVRTQRWLTTAYGQVTRSFKTPTLDQLFSQRTVAVPFPPYSVALSNADLDPQYGLTRELGLYVRTELLPGRLAAELDVAAYQIDMEDEIDFSLQEFAYVNVGQSRHRGVESGLALQAGAVRLYGTYTYQAATYEQGDFEGNFLKAIPRDLFAAGASAARGPLRGSLTLRGASRIWLDDANTIPLDGWTAVDARAAWRVPVGGASATVFAEAYNVLDAAYSTTGFPDAAGSGEVYYYPVAGRQLRLGLAVGR